MKDKWGSLWKIRKGIRLDEVEGIVGRFYILLGKYSNFMFILIKRLIGLRHFPGNQIVLFPFVFISRPFFQGYVYITNLQWIGTRWTTYQVSRLDQCNGLKLEKTIINLKFTFAYPPNLSTGVIHVVTNGA